MQRAKASAPSARGDPAACFVLLCVVAEPQAATDIARIVVATIAVVARSCGSPGRACGSRHPCISNLRRITSALRTLFDEPGGSAASLGVMSYEPNQEIIERYARVLVDFALGDGAGIKTGDTVRVVGPRRRSR